MCIDLGFLVVGNLEENTKTRNREPRVLNLTFQQLERLETQSLVVFEVFVMVMLGTVDEG